jgi:acyl-CoA thioesterase FadM
MLAVMNDRHHGQVFRWESQLRFRETDPFGWMFYGSVFDIAHDCFEDFVGHLEIDWKDWFEHPEWGVPVRATSAEYMAPLKAGEAFVIQLSLSHLGESSLTAVHQFWKGQQLCAKISTTHVFVTRPGAGGEVRSVAIPTRFRDKLTPYLKLV